MKLEIHELAGKMLDAAVYSEIRDMPEYPLLYGELQERDGRMFLQNKDDPLGRFFEPSENWAQGGLIIERFGIWLTGKKTIADPLCFSHWTAHIEGKSDLYGTRGFITTGPTPLIAAMRAFVFSRHGEAVDL